MNRVVRCRHQVAALVVALAAWTAAAQAQTEDGGVPGDWLMRYAGARTVGLGGAFVATCDDALAMLWNPAGLSQLDQNELLFENTRLYESTSLNGFGFAVPGNWLPTFGLSVVSLNSGDFQKTNELNDALGTFKEGETAFLFTVAKHFNTRFAVGTNLKVVRQSVEDFSAGGVGFDLGGVYNVTPGLRVGLSAMNLGGPSMTLRDVAETYPTVYRGGFAAHVLSGRGLVAAELDQSEGFGLGLHGGAEYWVQPMLALRVGFDDDHGTGGFSYRFAPGYQFDYGLSYQELGTNHRFGISYRFGGFFASSKADPTVFSPTGEHAVTKILLNARTKGETEAWTLGLVNKSDEVVRRFGGKGPPPAHLLWDGKDETGLPLADGVYRYQLVVTDREGRSVTSPTHSVEISTGGPQGTVPLVTNP